jgi:hypothetical protein
VNVEFVEAGVARGFGAEGPVRRLPFSHMKSDYKISAMLFIVLTSLASLVSVGVVYGPLATSETV